MKATGFVKRIDELGRIVIPKDIRKALGVQNLDSLEFFMDDGSVVLKKFGETCSLCSNTEELSEFKGKFVCSECIKELRTL